jgi:hypothetical protein
MRPFLTVEVEVAVQLLYRYLYKKLHTFAILTGLFRGREKSSTCVLKTDGRGNSSILFFFEGGAAG